ncbi:MAG: IS21 family transposase [Planctomycetes bacterium]|nr:IS21 family transposase [Planctomycetota bacterium]
MDIWLLQRQGHSVHSISRITGLNRRTVDKYLEAGEIPKYKVENRRSELEPYHLMIKDWLSGQNYQATRVYELVSFQGYQGSYETVKRYVGQVKGERDRVAYLRFETHPGLQAQVDLADFKVAIAPAEELTIYVFIMVLGFSRHMYVEFIDRCTMTTFLDCHKNAFGYFGGIPGEGLYDNLKNVVIKHLVGRVEFNATFADFALHYRFKPLVCPPYSPWCKGKVERPIDYVRERFWRGYQFTDLVRANSDMLDWLNTVAANRIHGTHRQQVCERFLVEKPYLGEIPNRPYDTSEKVTRKVYKDCMVAFMGNWYRVPHKYVGKKVLLKIKNGFMRVFYDDAELATYRIAEGKGNIVSHPWLIEALKNDREQRERKYRIVPGKGKATRGLLKDGLRHELVQIRPVSEYASVIGGGPWNN